MANINYMNGYKKTNPTIIEISLIKPKQQTISVEFDTEKQATKFMGSYATCKVHSKSAKKKQFPKFIAGQSALPIIEDVHEKPNTNTNKKSHVQTQTKLTSKKKTDTADAFEKNVKTEWEREKKTAAFKRISKHEKLVKMRYEEVLRLVYKSMLKSKKKYDRTEMDKRYEIMKKKVDFAHYMDGDVADSEFSDDYGNYDLYDENYYIDNYAEDILDEMYMEGFKSGLNVANRLKSNSVKKSKKRYNYYNMH
eukprot:230353_1